jgi:hypothetical protein
LQYRRAKKYLSPVLDGRGTFLEKKLDKKYIGHILLKYIGHIQKYRHYMSCMNYGKRGEEMSVKGGGAPIGFYAKRQRNYLKNLRIRGYEKATKEWEKKLAGAEENWKQKLADQEAKTLELKQRIKALFLDFIPGAMVSSGYEETYRKFRSRFPEIIQ